LISTRPRPAHTTFFPRGGEIKRRKNVNQRKQLLRARVLAHRAQDVFAFLCPWGHYTHPSLPDSYLSVALPLSCDWARGIRFQIYLRVLNGWMVHAGLRGAVVR
ncbi:unnamed protein product, partial [Laminaria digitata]